MKNDVLLEPLVALTIHENGCLNFRSSTLMDDQGYDKTLSSPSPKLYPKGTDVFSPKRSLLKNEILQRLSSGSVTIETVLPPFSYV